MKVLMLAGLALACVFRLGGAVPAAAGCDPVGNVKFVCGQAGPEDLVNVPGGEWVLTSSFAASGSIRLIRVRDLTTTTLFPTDAPKERLDAKTYDSCPGPLDAAARGTFQAHGLHLRPGSNSAHTLYVVHHGSRESVEVFEFDARTKTPLLTWIGCAVAPEPIGLNSVVSLPEGGFVSSNYAARGDAAGRGRMMAGENNGELWEWHTGAGWKKVPGSEASGANGLEVSKDGKWFYYGGWGNRTFIRLSRGQTPVKRDVVQLDFRVDNLHWAPDGWLLAAGQGGPDAALFGRGRGTAPPAGAPATSNVVKVHPGTLAVKELVRYPFSETFGFGTGAIQVGKEIWVGAVFGDKIARFPAP